MYRIINIKNYLGKLKQQEKLKLLVDDLKLGKTLRGWIKQELNSIENKSKNKYNRIKKRIKNPPGYDLAHERGREKMKGFGYEHTKLICKKDHKNQHKYDNFGKYNRTRCFQKFYIY
jgi:hypothetical protein